MEKEGAEAAAKAMQELGVEITMDAQAAQGEADEQGQLAVMNVMINKAYDGILCSAIADGNLLPAWRKP